MKELGPTAREFLETHRRNGLLTDAARARIKQQVMVRVSTVGTGAAVAGKAAGMSLASKVVLVALGVTGVVGAGSLSLRALRSPAPSQGTRAETAAPPARDVGGTALAPAPVATPSVAPAAPGAASALARPAVPARASTAAPALVPRAVSARAPTGSAVARAPRPAVASVAFPSSGAVDLGRHDPARNMDDPPVVSAQESPTPPAARVEGPDPEPELRALREARDDLRAGRPASAYRRLEDFRRQNPGGMLAQERSALSAIALCEAQPGRAAEARAAEFLRRSPESPLAARVKSACARDGAR